MKKLRVLLVDDEIMIREGFKRLFDWESHDCQVVGEAADGMEALTKIDQHPHYKRAEGHPTGPDQTPGHGLCHRVRLR